MRMRTRTAIAALLTAGLVPLSGTAPASAAPAKHADDFNGDGYRDYVHTWWGGSAGGGLRVTFGTANGPGTATQLIDQGSPGVPGADETDDMFGEVRAAADFDRDGYGDLAVAALGEDVDGREDQGAVTILWGSASGLSGGTSVPNKGAKQSFGHFGQDLATGDFNGDGKPDLAAVSASKAYVYRGTLTRSGTTGSVTTLDKTSFNAEALIAGKVTKDSATDLVIIGEVVSPGVRAADAWFIKGGSTLTSGKTLRVNKSATEGGDGLVADFDKDGYGDIAIGNGADAKHKGAVSIWRGGSTGPGTSTRLTQASSGVAGTPEAEDNFGADLSAGDTNGDGYPDLAVGAYGEAVDGSDYAGGVHILRGGSGGVTGTASQWFARNSPGIPGALDMDDYFGATVRLRDTDRDGFADLYVTGTVGSLRLSGSSSGITTAGATAVDTELVGGFLQ
ncbi:FG-GAP and VCBS repeat-containing protein [Streptomyces sp. NBC_01304]|uniref:FG-GAP and VCBS repeat-containing protein n=1 Tax=Streptomyces sp. NBC_01304 TaxID=2903818 RepID=UPI002E0F6227|nr:FG-GAP and VCBS repeat-containing protein [Streptomyces sp. NBC_01304]